MRCIVQAYFKDERGEWHQPGEEVHFQGEEAELHEVGGRVKIVRTAMVEADNTRKRGRPKNNGIKTYN